jgi:hypothetical protein
MWVLQTSKLEKYSHTWLDVGSVVIATLQKFDWNIVQLGNQDHRSAHT